MTRRELIHLLATLPGALDDEIRIGTTDSSQNDYHDNWPIFQVYIPLESHNLEIEIII